MITCPNCGTANQDGSRSCVKCGTALSSPAGRRCPMCGTMNPPGNVTCTSCGARLVPVTASGGPETPPAEPEVPEWLARLAPAAAPSKPLSQQPAEPVPPAAASEPDDWLSRLRGALPEQPTEPVTTGPATPDEQVPDWLRGVPVAPAGEPGFDLAARLRGAPEPPLPTAPAAPPPAEAEVPDWLAQLTPAPAKGPEPAAPPAPPPAQAEVPEWLTQLAPAPTKGPEPAAPPAPPPAQAEVPEWLTQLAPAPTKGPEPAAPPAPPPAQAEVPEWLTQLAPTPAKGPEPAAPPVAESDLPEWLKGFAAQPPAPSAPAAPVKTPFVGEQAPAPEELPAWLKDISGPQGAPPAPAATPQALAEMPEWLKEPEPPAPASSQAAAPFVVPVPPGTGELPAWVKELEPSEAGASRPGGLAPVSPALSVPVEPSPPSAPSESGLVAAQLPSWLEALRPKELAPTFTAPKEEEATEAEGVLAGLHGALPATTVAWQSLGAGISMRPEITPDDLARAGALQELLARGAAIPVPREGTSRAQRLWSSTQRLFVFLVIAAAVVISLLPGMSLGLVGAPELAGAGDKMYGSIDRLKPGDPVLVAFDYDASQSPEMDTQARAVMRHLSAHQARVSVVSLYAAGPAAAQVVISETSRLMSTTVPLAANLGYMPGQATAVAFVDTAPYSMVIELAATPDTLRWWAEQLTARPGAPPLFAGVSAQAEPMSLPYLQSQQVNGMIVGIRDAVAYELRLGSVKQGEEPQRLAPLESIATANVALIGLILLGGLVQLVSGSGSRSGDGRRRK